MNGTQMQHLDFYNTLYQDIQQTDSEAAGRLQEGVNILLHKLKFVPQEQRPTVLILEQASNFEPVFNHQLADSISIAGGKLLAEKYDNPSLLFIVQENDALYGAIPELLQDDILSRTDALQSNRIYIIQKRDIGKVVNDFLYDTEIFAEIIQSKYFVFGHQGIAWVPFETSL